MRCSASVQLATLADMADQSNPGEFLGRKIPTIQILDVGAMATGEERYHPLVASGLAEVTGFEPNPAEYACPDC